MQRPKVFPAPSVVPHNKVYRTCNRSQAGPQYSLAGKQLPLRGTEGPHQPGDRQNFPEEVHYSRGTPGTAVWLNLWDLRCLASAGRSGTAGGTSVSGDPSWGTMGDACRLPPLR